MKEFYNDPLEYLRDLWTHDRALFQMTAALIIAKKSGVVHTDGGGTCTSQNCSGTTGCHPTTPNGDCECSGPNGPCVWVPDIG